VPEVYIVVQGGGDVCEETEVDDVVLVMVICDSEGNALNDVTTFVLSVGVSVGVSVSLPVGVLIVL